MPCMVASSFPFTSGADTPKEAVSLESYNFLTKFKNCLGFFVFPKSDLCYKQPNSSLHMSLLCFDIPYTISSHYHFHFFQLLLGGNLSTYKFYDLWGSPGTMQATKILLCYWSMFIKDPSQDTLRGILCNFCILGLKNLIPRGFPGVFIQTFYFIVHVIPACY